ncbi:hypothetical protein AB0958_34470 [Streptomyces sp. NPDC006655]|uniref:hypothetical protein n=1 Tax=Streptomyces sp. NPDC006655 TaxID=3156898 RepID=UPI0034539093
MHSTISRWTVAVVAAVALTACTGRQLTPPAAAGRPTPPASDPARHLPIEAYMLTPWQSVELDHVTDAAISACMSRYGWNYPVAQLPAPDSAAVASRALLYRRYGVTDPASVRIWGYHLPHAPRNAPRTPAPAVNLSQFPPAARSTLLGAAAGPVPHSAAGTAIPHGGCVGEAHGLIHADSASSQGPGAEPGGLIARIKQKTFERSLGDHRVTAVFARWSACMAARGYHLADPLHAADHLSMAAPKPSRAEITQALADVACKKRTGLVARWLAVESEYQRSMMAKNAGPLAAVAAARAREAADINSLMSRFGG